MNELLHRIAALFRKELLAILNDRSSRAILIVPAIMQSLIFGYAATYDLQRVDYALLDQNQGGAASRTNDSDHQGPECRSRRCRVDWIWLSAEWVGFTANRYRHGHHATQADP